MGTPPCMLWIDGLPLSPQHFQHVDRFHERVLDRRIAVLSRGTTWGVRELAFDREALREGRLRVLRLEAVFPDGTYVDVSEQEPIVDRPLVGLGADRTTVELHVAIARRCEGRPEVGPPHARLRRLERRALDVHTEEPAEPHTLELGVPNVRLVFGHEPREDMETLLVGAVRRDAQGALALVDVCMPPLLRISASDVLMRQLAALVGQLAARRDALLRGRRERDVATIEVEATDVTRFLLLQTLSSHLPVLGHLLRRGDCGPGVLYERLLELLGGLSAYSVDAELDVPELDERDLGGTLLPLLALVARRVAATDRERSRTTALEARADGLHFAALDDEMARCDRFLLGVRSARPEEEVVSSLASLSKVASYRDITKVLSSATAGAPLRIVHRPPPEVATRAGEVYFEVEREDAFFRSALTERGVAVFLPVRPFDPASTRVSLVGIVRSDRLLERARPARAEPYESRS